MQQLRYRTVRIKPHAMQFVINELPLLLLCPIGLIYAGMDGLPLTHLILAYSFPHLALPFHLFETDDL